MAVGAKPGSVTLNTTYTVATAAQPYNTNAVVVAPLTEGSGNPANLVSGGPALTLTSDNPGTSLPTWGSDAIGAYIQLANDGNNQRIEIADVASLRGGPLSFEILIDPGNLDNAAPPFFGKGTNYAGNNGEGNWLQLVSSGGGTYEVRLSPGTSGLIARSGADLTTGLQRRRLTLAAPMTYTSIRLWTNGSEDSYASGGDYFSIAGDLDSTEPIRIQAPGAAVKIYDIRAFSRVQEDVESGLADANYWLPITAAASAPDPPTGLTATDDLTTKIALSWTAADGATTYKVYRATEDNLASAEELATGVTATAYDDTTAAAGTPYWYWVVAVNGTGDSDPSDSAEGLRLGESTLPEGYRVVDPETGTRYIVKSGVMVPIPEAPRMRAKALISTNQSIASGTALVPVAWDSCSEEGGDWWDAGDPTKLTVPAGGAGLYLIGGAMRFAPNATGIRRVVVRKNGVSIGRGRELNPSATVTAEAQAFGRPFDCYLAVGDVITLVVVQDSGDALELESADNGTWLSLARMGV